MIEYDGSHSYGRAFLVGLLNTILVSAIGIFFATIAGVIVGVSRLSDNYLIAKVAEWYVEIFRNIPLILQIFSGILRHCEHCLFLENGISFNDISFLTIKGWYVPKFIWTNFNIFLLSLIAALIAIYFTNSYATKQREQFGKQLPTAIISLSILILVPLITFLFWSFSYF